MKDDDIRKWKDVPMFYQNLKKRAVRHGVKNKPVLITIEFYQSNCFKPYPFSKSISRCIILKQVENEG